MMTNLKITLADGREISQISYFVQNLAVSLSAGIAESILLQHAEGLAKRIWPEEHCEVLKPSHDPQSSPFSTQFLCMGEFISSKPLPDSDEMVSSLVIIWFQTLLSPECEQEALRALRLVDWNQKARGFSW